MGLTALFFCFINYLYIGNMKYISPELPFGALGMQMYTLKTSVYFFVFFAFVSYYFFDKLRHDSMQECVQATRGGLLKLYGGQLLVMVLVNLVLTVTVAAYNVYAYAALQINRAEVLASILGCVFLYFFLVAFIAVLLGLAVALTMKRLPACMVLAAVCLFSSTIFLALVEGIYNATSINLFPFYELISLYPRGLEYMPPHSTGYSLLPDRIAATVFWVALFLLIILWKTLRNRVKAHKVAALVCAAASIASFAMYCAPQARILTANNAKGDFLIDRDYYGAPGNAVQKEEAGGFTVTGYDMDLSVTTQLRAAVTVRVDQPDLPAYKFTLHRNYRVRKITRQDSERLEFQQDGDYIEVSNRDGAPVESLTFTYAGNNPTYFSHMQGISLPGHFAYYPHSGYRRLYDTSGQGFYKTTLPEPVDITLHMRYCKEIFTNLPKMGDNTYAGKTDGVTIFAGFYEERSVEGIDVVYPYLDTEQFGNGYLEESLRGFISQKKDNREIRRIMLLPLMNIGTHGVCHYYADGTLVCMQLRGLDERYPLSFVDSIKREVYTLVQHYRNNRADFISQMQSEQEVAGQNEETGPAMRLQDAVGKLGEDQALALADAYLADKTDRRSADEFLRDINAID